MTGADEENGTIVDQCACCSKTPSKSSMLLPRGRAVFQQPQREARETRNDAAVVPSVFPRLPSPLLKTPPAPVSTGTPISPCNAVKWIVQGRNSLVVSFQRHVHRLVDRFQQVELLGGSALPRAIKRIIGSRLHFCRTGSDAPAHPLDITAEAIRLAASKDLPCQRGGQHTVAEASPHERRLERCLDRRSRRDGLLDFVGGSTSEWGGLGLPNDWRSRCLQRYILLASFARPARMKAVCGDNKLAVLATACP